MKRVFIQVDQERDEKTGEMIGISVDVPITTTPVEIAQAIEIMWPKCTFYSVDSYPEEE